jgi:hypothetical protein
MKLFLSFLSAVLISGCATGPIYSPVTPPAPDQALLYIYRVSTLSGVLVPMNLKINGEEKGTLPNYSYTSEYVSPGHLVLSANMRVTVSAEISAGQTYYFKIYQVATGLFINNRLEMVSPEVAIADLKDLRRATALK